MARVRPRGERVRTFILENVEAHPTDIAKVTAAKFELSRQAVNKHLRNLVGEGALVETGSTRSKTFNLCAVQDWSKWYQPQGLEEDVVWTSDVNPQLRLPENATRIWNYCVTEILNNAIDHSDAGSISIDIKKNATLTEISIYDTGVGSFKKIMDALGLPIKSLPCWSWPKAALQLILVDTRRQGIFFSSRMVDNFYIFSRGTFFSHDIKMEHQDWLTHGESKSQSGTLVYMALTNHTARTTKKVFDEFSTVEDDGLA